MKSRHYLIYIPGLGDGHPTFQRWAVKAWQCFGVRSELFAINWADTQYVTRSAALRALIQQKSARGYRVSLIGASAGGSAALNAFASQPQYIHRLVLIAGVANPNATVAAAVYRNNPSFKTSMHELAVHMPTLALDDRQKILSITGTADSVVYPANSHVSGGRSRQIWTRWHSLTIAYCLTLGAWQLVHDIKWT